MSALNPKLVQSVILLSLTEKEVLYMFLGNSIKLESKNNSFVEQELAEADEITAILPEANNNAAHTGFYTGSAKAHILDKLANGSTSEPDLAELLMKNKNWDKLQAKNNLSMIKSKLKQAGQIKISYEDGVCYWRLANEESKKETSENATVKSDTFFKPGSATYLILQAVQEQKSITQKDLAELLKKKKNWPSHMINNKLWECKNSLVKHNLVKVIPGSPGKSVWSVI